MSRPKRIRIFLQTRTVLVLFGYDELVCSTKLLPADFAGWDDEAGGNLTGLTTSRQFTVLDTNSVGQNEATEVRV